MHLVLHAFHHPTGLSLVPILLGAFVLGFAVQRVLAVVGDRWWPVPTGHPAAPTRDGAEPDGPD